MPTPFKAAQTTGYAPSRRAPTRVTVFGNTTTPVSSPFQGGSAYKSTVPFSQYVGAPTVSPGAPSRGRVNEPEDDPIKPPTPPNIPPPESTRIPPPPLGMRPPGVGTSPVGGVVPPPRPPSVGVEPTPGPVGPTFAQAQAWAQGIGNGSISLGEALRQLYGSGQQTPPGGPTGAPSTGRTPGLPIGPRPMPAGIPSITPGPGAGTGGSPPWMSYVPSGLRPYWQAQAAMGQSPPAHMLSGWGYTEPTGYNGRGGGRPPSDRDPRPPAEDEDGRTIKPNPGDPNNPPPSGGTPDPWSGNIVGSGKFKWDTSIEEAQRELPGEAEYYNRQIGERNRAAWDRTQSTLDAVNEALNERGFGGGTIQEDRTAEGYGQFFNEAASNAQAGQLARTQAREKRIGEARDFEFQKMLEAMRYAANLKNENSITDEEQMRDAMAAISRAWGGMFSNTWGNPYGS